MPTKKEKKNVFHGRTNADVIKAIEENPSLSNDEIRDMAIEVMVDDLLKVYPKASPKTKLGREQLNKLARGLADQLALATRQMVVAELIEAMQNTVEMDAIDRPMSQEAVAYVRQNPEASIKATFVNVVDHAFSVIESAYYGPPIIAKDGRKKSAVQIKDQDEQMLDIALQTNQKGEA